MVGAAPETSTPTTPRTSMAKSCAVDMRAATVMVRTALAEEVGLISPHASHLVVAAGLVGDSSQRLA